MSLRRVALRFLAETVAGNFLFGVGQHLGDAVGTVLARKIDPEHGKHPNPDEDQEG